VHLAIAVPFFFRIDRYVQDQMFCPWITFFVEGITITSAAEVWPTRNINDIEIFDLIFYSLFIMRIEHNMNSMTIEIYKYYSVSCLKLDFLISMLF